MTKFKLFQVLPAVVAALGGALVTMAPAHAAVVVADFDPAYGAAIPNLGFKGSASFYVNDACLALSGQVLNGAACSGNSMHVIAAQVDFYNLAAPETTLLSVVYGTGVGEFEVNGAFVGGGVVLGLDTNISRAKAVNIAEFGPNPINFNGFMSLLFFTGIDNNVAPNAVASINQTPSNVVTGIGGAKLFANCTTTNISSCDQYISESAPAPVQYSTTLPEPTTPALVLAALAAAAMARRRRA